MPKKFNPEGSNYDYQTALAYGMGPSGKGDNAGHWGSVAPVSDDEAMKNEISKDSYVVLKGKSHKTFDKTEAAEKERGSKIEKHGKRYYSVPMKKGGKVRSASKRADGCAVKGKTRA